jgi:PIN domain
MLQNYVSADTNMFYRFVTQGKAGCEPCHWDEVLQAVENNNIALIVSEVVVLEFEHKVRKLNEDFSGKVGTALESIDSALDKKTLWNEIGDLPSFVKDQVLGWKNKRIEEAESRCKLVQELFHSPKVTILPFDHDLMVRSRKRMLSGRWRGKSDSTDADCFIIESIARHLEGIMGECQLLFCTENTKEFGLPVKDKFSLHPLLKQGLPPTELFIEFGSMLAFLKAQKPVETIDPAEEKKALEEEINEQEMATLMGELIADIPDYPAPVPATLSSGGRIPSIAELGRLVGKREDEFRLSASALLGIERMAREAKEIHEAFRKAATSPSFDFTRIAREARERQEAFAMRTSDSFRHALNQMDRITREREEMLRKAASYLKFNFNTVAQDAVRRLGMPDNQVFQTSTEEVRHALSIEDSSVESCEPKDEGKSKGGKIEGDIQDC